MTTAALAAALTTAWPDVQFRIDHDATVTWCDGPTPAQVAATLERAGVAPDRCTLHRTVSPGLVAVDALRGFPPPPPRGTLPPATGDTLRHASTVDAATITPDEAATARTVVDLATTHADWARCPALAVAETAVAHLHDPATADALRFGRASLDPARNAQLRRLLADAFGHTRFTVRNGPWRTAAIAWTDGPTPTQVAATLPDTFPGGWPAMYTLNRTVTDELTAVAALRPAHQATALDDPRITFALNDTTNRATGVDAATVTPTERAQASLVLTLAANHPDWAVDRNRAIRDTARTHRDVVTAATC
jgi:hypothetical protein